MSFCDITQFIKSMLFDGDGALPVAYVITTVPDTISRKNKDSLLAVLTSWGGKGGGGLTGSIAMLPWGFHDVSDGGRSPCDKQLSAPPPFQKCSSWFMFLRNIGQ